jgi:hypothetical protein
MKVPKRKKKKPVQNFPQPIPKKDVLKGASEVYSKRPMLLWENSRVWDIRDLATGGDGKLNKEKFLHEMSALWDHLTDESRNRNSKSMNIWLQTKLPTQREHLRQCEKYGYEPYEEVFDDEF